MSGKTSISKARSYKDIGAFLDEHDATEFGEQIDVEFEVDIHSQVRYYPIDNHFTNSLSKLAEKRGISKVTLINLWIQEKINQTNIDKKSNEAV
jgi:hypothetical protein